MKAIRRRLRLWVAAWLVVQAASLSAFVPRDCCAAHRPASHQAPSCHESAPAPHCSMRGECDGPMAALVTVLSNIGVLPAALTVSPDLHASPVRVRPLERLLSRLAPPDSPPPRT